MRSWATYGYCCRARLLYRHVPEEELDLIQLTARQVAQTGTGPSEVVRRQIWRC